MRLKQKGSGIWGNHPYIFISIEAVNTQHGKFNTTHFENIQTSQTYILRYVVFSINKTIIGDHFESIGREHRISGVSPEENGIAVIIPIGDSIHIRGFSSQMSPELNFSENSEPEGK